jgi:hypothetical protein
MMKSSLDWIDYIHSVFAPDDTERQKQHLEDIIVDIKSVIRTIEEREKE